MKFSLRQLRRGFCGTSITSAALLGAGALFPQSVDAGLVFTFSERVDRSGVQIAVDGDYDITGLEQRGFQGSPGTSLVNTDFSERFQSVVGASIGHVIGDAVTLFETTEELNLFNFFSPELQFGDNFGIITFPGGNFTTLSLGSTEPLGSLAGTMFVPGINLFRLQPREQAIVWGPGEDQRLQVVVDFSVLSGDLNQDGFVGIEDLDIVLANFGGSVEPGSLISGDPTGDGIVSAIDLNVVISNYGAGFAPIGAAPEPSTLLTLGLSGMLCHHRRRGNRSTSRGVRLCRSRNN